MNEKELQEYCDKLLHEQSFILNVKYKNIICKIDSDIRQLRVDGHIGMKEMIKVLKVLSDNIYDTNNMEK